ncbi:hypothetical protein BGZ65_010846, partial [Modicella reniformis]
DVRNIGLSSVLILSDPNQHSRRECTIYPASALSFPRPRVPLTEEELTRAKTNLDNALGTLEQQLELKRKRIERLRASLASKADIISGCQELLTGPLCSAFYTGGRLGSATHEDLGSFQRKRDQRRKKVLERLVPIIGNTLSETFEPSVEDDESNKQQIEESTQLATLECASGYIPSKLGITIWFGVRVWNHSTQTVYNIRLSVGQQSSHGTVLPRMDPQTGGVMLGVVQLEPLMLKDDEYLDRSRATARVLTNTVRLHFDKQQGPEDVNMNHVTITIPKFPVVEGCSHPWRAWLVDLLLPSHISCRLQGINGTRLLILMQDGLGLASNGDDGSFGSLEGGLIVTTKQDTQSTLSKGSLYDTWDVMFKAQLEVMA